MGVVLRLIILSSFVLSNVFAATTSVFVKGVTETSGWYDVNKTFIEGPNGDDELCWAAAASNIIKWWQDQQGFVPPGTPSGTPTSSYSSNIFQTFADSFVNDGGQSIDGFSWWLTGYTCTTLSYSMKPGASAAGYWSSGISDIENYIYSVDLEEAFLMGEDAYFSFNSNITQYVSMGWGISLSIELVTGEGGHAITMWGYEIDDETNMITSIYLTDSDDVPYDEQPHMEKRLFSVDLAYDDNRVLLAGDEYPDYYISDLWFFSPFGIPEPSTITLSASFVLWAMLRRRKCSFKA